MLQLLYNDCSTLKLTDLALKHKRVDIYVDHGIQDVELVPTLYLPRPELEEVVVTQLEKETEVFSGVLGSEMHGEAATITDVPIEIIGFETVGGKTYSIEFDVEVSDDCEAEYVGLHGFEVEDLSEFELKKENEDVNESELQKEVDCDSLSGNDEELLEIRGKWNESDKNSEEVNSETENEITTTKVGDDFSMDGIQVELGEDYDSDDPPSYELENEDTAIEVCNHFSKVKFPSYNPQVEPPILEEGLLFEDGRQFKDAIIKYAVHTKRDLRLKKNEPKRVRVKCVENCPFNCYASWDERFRCFQIKKV